MSVFQVAILFIYTLGMSLGQLLFKFAAHSLSTTNETSFTAVKKIVQLGTNPYFAGAMAMYFGLSVFWVWILTFIPLSRAYPFVALAFVITPILSHFLFAEALDPSFYFGVVFIMVGLALVVR